MLHPRFFASLALPNGYASFSSYKELAPCKRQEAANCPMHEGIPVCPLVLCQLQLVRPPPQRNLPTLDLHEVETRREVGDEGGVVGADGGGACFNRGLRGLKTSSQRSSG